MASKITIESENVGPIIVVKPAGRLDSGQVDVFDRYLGTVVAGGKYFIVLDLVQVTFMASSALRILLLVHKKIARQGGSLVICNVQPHVQSLLAVAGFDRMLKQAPDLDSALDAAGPKGGQPRPPRKLRQSQPLAAQSTVEDHSQAVGSTRPRRRGFFGGIWHLVTAPWRIFRALLALARDDAPPHSR